MGMNKWMLVGFALVGTALAQGQTLNLQHLDKLASKTDEVVNIKLDGSLLQMASGFMSEDDKDSAQLKLVLKGIQGITVRSFKFKEDGAYSKADVDEVEKQLSSPEWSRIVEVREGNRDRSLIYLRTARGQLGGLAIVAAEPRELTVVYIAGDIDLAKLKKLGGQFGIPSMTDKKQKLKSRQEEDEE